jgi:nitrogen fixation-related uncharacterized protein
MQEIIADLIRGVGCAFLWTVSLGRYRPSDQASEGAIGLSIVLGAMAVAYWWNA